MIQPTTIWKYEFAITDSFTLEMPEDAIILSVQLQTIYRRGGIDGWQPVFWAEVNESVRKVKRHFYVIGTGHKIPSRSSYRGTVQTQVGLVCHLYEHFPEGSL